MPKVSESALSFIDRSERIVNMLREGFYSLEDQSLFVQLDDQKRELLRNAAHDLYVRLKGVVCDEQRDRIRAALGRAVQVVLSWQVGHELRTPEQAYREQEIIQRASTILIEMQMHLVVQVKQNKKVPTTDSAKAAQQSSATDDKPPKRRPRGLLYQEVDALIKRGLKSPTAIAKHINQIDTREYKPTTAGAVRGTKRRIEDEEKQKKRTR
jgi:hypothetical protein